MLATPMTIYLNHAGTSWPKPAAVRDATRAAADAPPHHWPGLFDRAVERVARFFALPDPAGLLFTTSCTEALAVAIESLPWAAGDRVITSTMEHHALARPVLNLARTRGVIHTIAPRAADGPIDLAYVAEALARDGARLVACSMASNVTGEILPVAELTALAHRHGALMLVDAAQTAGSVPIDVGQLGADLFVFAGHKGPHAPQGIGALYASPAVTFESPTASCDLSAGTCQTSLGYCDVGSVNLPAAAGLAAGLDWLAARGVDAVRATVRERTAQLLSGLAELPAITVYGTPDPDARTAAVSITAHAIDSLELAEQLRARGVIARGGHHCAPLAHRAIGTEVGGTLRMSAGPDTSPDDIARALAILGDLLRA
jgi:selenocysteine lyase/cysteine desulfurase